MITQKTEAVVLKHTDTSDSDRVYTLFTKDYGILRARAFGVRRITSKRIGSLDTLNLVSISFTQKNDLYTVDEVVIKDSFSNIKSDQSKIYKAYYLLELCLKAIEEAHPERRLFVLLSKILGKINTQESVDVYVSYFELKLLTELGYQLPDDQMLAALSNLDAGNITKSVYDKNKRDIDRTLKFHIHQNIPGTFNSLKLIN